MSAYGPEHGLPASAKGPEEWRQLVKGVAEALEDRSVDPGRRFEVLLAELGDFREVSIVAGSRSLAGSGALNDGLSVPITTGDDQVTLRAVPRVYGRVQPWQRQLLQTAACFARMLVELERRPAARPVPLPVDPRHGALLGTSIAMQGLRTRIDRVARTNFTVLVEGESGVGKELVARAIHEGSSRRRGPFVAVNCAALVETLLEAELFGIEDRTATGVRGRKGKFEHADGGTLFLDEISDLTLPAQAKLLRALQELSVERVGGQGAQPVNTRIVAATNRGLVSLVEAGRFRLDLYHRLNSLEIRVPPLRSRPDDIPELVSRLLERHRAFRALSFSTEAMDALQTYDWPGNVRELERVVERAVTLAESDRVTLADLPPAVARRYNDILLPALREGATLRAWGSRYVRLILERCQNNKREACRVLGISYHTLQAYLRYPRRVSGPSSSVPVSKPGAPPGQSVQALGVRREDDA